MDSIKTIITELKEAKRQITDPDKMTVRTVYHRSENFGYNNLTLRCRYTPGHVDDLIKRLYQPCKWLESDGAKSVKQTKHTSRRARFSYPVLDGFINDGEVENAETYAELYGRRLFYRCKVSTDTPPEWHPVQSARAIDHDPRFFIGKVDGEYFIYTDITGGRLCKEGSSSVSGALKVFNDTVEKYGADLIDRAVKDSWRTYWKNKLEWKPYEWD